MNLRICYCYLSCVVIGEMNLTCLSRVMICLILSSHNTYW